ncbi:MAG: hypothetical protein WCW04_03735 [Candidatus Paceibacterota bacterium]
MELTAWILTFAGCILGAVSIIIAVRVLNKQDDTQRMLKEIEEKKIESEDRKFIKSRMDAKANIRLEVVLELLTALDKYQTALFPLKNWLEKEAPDYIDVDRKYLEISKHEGVDLFEQEQVVFHMTSKIQLLFNFKDQEIESIMKKILAVITNVQQYRKFVRENNKEKFPVILNELNEYIVEIGYFIAVIPSIFAKYVNDDISDIAKSVGSKSRRVSKNR